MWSICKKELALFFGNLSGYVAIILFLVVSGIYLFLLEESSIFNNGYANLSSFFEFAPWVFIFLLPAICIRVFSEEFKTGTFEILKTKPLSSWQITLGKFSAVMIIVFVTLLPTIIYIITVQYFSINNLIDTGEIAGSYIGLIFLASVFAAISLACGSFTSSAIVAFLLAAFSCLVLYFGFTAISKLPALQGSADYYIAMLGIDFHYQSISRGVIDTRDIIYFITVITLSLAICVYNLNRRSN